MKIIRVTDQEYGHFLGQEVATENVKYYRVLSDKGLTVGRFVLDKIYSIRMVVDLVLTVELTERIWRLICKKIRKTFYITLSKYRTDYIKFLRSHGVVEEDLEIKKRVVFKQLQ